MKILTARQMREVDRITIEQLAISGVLLMENAGRNVFNVIKEKFRDVATRRIVVLCGKGNNGGDGLVVARCMIEAGLAPRVILLATPESLQGDARQKYDLLRNAASEP